MVGASQDAVQTGRYRLVRLIGSGGMGEVHLAIHEGPQGFSRVVALKRIRPAADALQQQLLQHFLDEARLVARLSHRNVIQIHELGETPEGFFVAMEYVRGPSIEKLLERLASQGERMPPALALDVAAQVADGLDYAFSAKDETGKPMRIVHRDVSPQNILVSVSGDVKLIDFGVAKSALQQHVTTGPVVKGKIAYMSPEQSRGEALDGRSDLFCLGIVLYEMLSGQHPFLQPEPLHTLQAIERAAFLPLTTVAPSLAPCDPVLACLLARAPAERFFDGGAVSEALQKLRHSLPSPPKRLGPFVASLFGPEYETGETAPLTAPPVDATVQRDSSERARTLAPIPLTTPAPQSAPVVAQQQPTARRNARVLAIAGLIATAGIGFGAVAFYQARANRAVLAIPPPLPPVPLAEPSPADPVKPKPPIKAEPLAIVVPAPVKPEAKPADTPKLPAKKGPLTVVVPPAAKPEAKPADTPRPPAKRGLQAPFELTYSFNGQETKTTVDHLPGTVVLAKKPILVMLELYPGDGLGKVICEPWQNLWMEGEFVGRTPMEVPNLGGGPVAFSLRLAKVHEPIHVRLSARPLEGKHQ